MTTLVVPCPPPPPNAVPIVRSNPTTQVWFLVKQLATSMHGTVDLFENQNGKLVAVKRSTLLRFSGNEFVDNPQIAAWIQKQLPSHPHLLPCLESCLHNDQHWFVTPYLPKGELFARVETRGALSFDLARNFLGQMISAVQHLHSYDVGHFDLSLENFLLDEDPETKQDKVVLMDLGAARPMVFIENFPQYRPGKPYYAAPEVCDPNCTFGLEADVFSLGVCLYMMVMKSAPFGHVSDVAYVMIRQGQMKRLHEMRKQKEIPADLTVLLTNMMSPDPRKRPTLSQVLADQWMVTSLSELPTASLPL